MNKILIVDDSETMRRIIMRVLRQADFQVETILEAANGVEGLQRLVSDPDIELILSDISMPEMDGIEFVRAVRSQRDKLSLPMVMISTEGGDVMLQHALESGANGFVMKPLTPESFREALESAFH